MNAPALLKVQVRDVIAGVGVRIVEPANVYECELGDHCFVGPFVEIQKGARIGARTKIQSHTFICELVEIGADCFIGHGVVFTNDLFTKGGPARGDRSLWKPTRIGDRVSIGSNATLLPVSVCDDVVIGAGAVVTRDIVVPGVYASNPARLMRKLSNQ
jgi:acetyltransferase-like isoleucine patch superfamily enzyme